MAIDLNKELAESSINLQDLFKEKKDNKNMVVKKVTKSKKATNETTEYINTVTAAPQEIIPTLIDPLDIIMSGGIYEGDFIEFYGDTGVGKSTALVHIAKNLCSQGYKVAYLDYERGMKQSENSLIHNMGLKPYMDIGQFELYNKGETTFTQLEADIAKCKADGVKFIFIDSLTAVNPSALMDNPIEKQTIGVEARLQTIFVRKYKSFAQMHGITFIFINQMRTKIALGWGETTEEKSAGAKALGFFCDMRLFFEKGPKLVRPESLGTTGKDDKVTFGNKAKVRTIKNRADRPDIKVPCPIIFGKGVSNPYFYYEICLNFKYIKSSTTGVRTLEIPGFGEVTGKGEMNFISEIAKNKDIVRQFLNDRGHLSLILNESPTEEEFEETDEVEEEIIEDNKKTEEVKV